MEENYHTRKRPTHTVRVKAPIHYAFPVCSMQQVHSKLHAEAAKLKNARIWRVRNFGYLPGQRGLLSAVWAVTVGGRLVWQRWNGRECCGPSLCLTEILCMTTAG